MAQPLIIKNTIVINASAAEVWDALVNPRQTKKYMFGCEAISNWKKGDPLLWKGVHEGKEIVFVKGFITDIQPEKLLVYTVYDPLNPAIEDIPENYLTVTYSLSSDKGKTTFVVTQGDYNTVADGKRRYEESYNNGEGWHPLLVQIKNLVEG
jgi:uncharacterized protein YndB with AHSA1/START domain